MISNLKPYPKYKDSGVPWLGEVPEHWEVKPVKRHYAIQLGKMLQTRPNNPDDIEVPYLKAQHIQWFSVRTSDAPRMWASPRDIQQFGITVGDLLVCEGGEGGRCGIVKEIQDGFIIQNALHRVRPRDHCRNNYLQYVMSVIAATGWFKALNNKATIAHFTREKFGALYMPIPAPDEQTAIARFLDWADRRIRRVIRLRERRIKLLEEYKQALINQAVTGKIDVRTGKPYPALKDSGVPWLGEVPEHWEVLPGHGCFVERKQPNIGLMETTVLSLSYGRIVVKKEEKLRGLVPASFETYQIVDPGDIVCRPTDLQNDQNSLRFGLVRYRGIITSAYMSLKTTGRLDSNFGYMLLHAYDVRKIFYGLGSGLRQNLDWRDFKRLPCLIPPLPEQTAIVEYLDAQTERIDAAVAATRREIDLLKEFRTRLIADVVTGKLDVRMAAAQLPEELTEEEAEEPEALDDAEGSAEDGADEEGLDYDAIPEEVGA